MNTYQGFMTAMIATLLAGGMCVPAGAQVVNPRITTDSSIDCSSAQAVVQQITKPGMTDEEKAVACWTFMLDHYYHWYPPREDNVPTDVRDFAKAINSYGFGPCFVNAPVLSALWVAAGLETRCWTITGHSIPEVRYGGAWHMLDGDARAWHRKADGQIASVEELAADPKLFTEPAGKSDPYYPFAAPDVAAKPLEPWGPPSKMMDLYLSRKDNYRYNRRAVLGHPMYLTLRPGEKISLSREHVGKWFKFGGMPESAVTNGPIDVSRTITYGNGTLAWRPELGGGALDQLLWMGSSNVTRKAGTLVPDKAGEAAVAVFRTWCPYVLVDATMALGLSADVEIGKVEISLDGGAAWTELPPPASIAGAGGAASYELAPHVSGRYEYLIRIVWYKGAVESLAFESTFQHAPLALPRLKAGVNKVTLLRGPDEGVVQLVLGNNKETKDRYIIDKQGLVDPLKSIQPAVYGEPAHVVYKLTAPHALTALSIGAQLSMDVGTNQHFTARYSLDGGKNWQDVWRIADNANNHNSQFEMDEHVTLDNPAGVREALVKFDMRRNSKYFSVAGIRLYGFYKQPQPERAKLGVTIAWQERRGEQWTERTHSLATGTFPHTFELSCAGEAVRLSRIEMSPAP